MNADSKFRPFIELARMDKPVGTFLVLWPALWALWIAAEGMPSWKNLIIFSLGAFVMRSAGCVINDIADRKIDGHVERTKGRPLADGRMTTELAIAYCLGFCVIALILVLFTNQMTILLSVVALLLAGIYPFMKRYTYLPQVFLGAAFAWAVPMAFAAETEALPPVVWLLFIATVVWTVAYDTIYAMMDREDDLKIGVKSTAILFGDMDKAIVATLQLTVIFILAAIGDQLLLGQIYFLGVLSVSLMFIYQQHLIRFRYPDQCLKAFKNNGWLGAVMFAAIVLDYALITK